MDVEEPLFGGLANGRVVRVGDTVRRPADASTPTIQALLAHLQARDFPAPEPLGLDVQGRESVSWLPGRASTHPWPAALLATDGARRVGALLRRYHDAVADFVPPAAALWRHGAQKMAPGEIVLHGDFAPHNLVWTAGLLSGVIDFELARPGLPMEDAVFCAVRVAPLRPDAASRAAGFAAPPDRRQRLQAFADGYGCATDALLDAARGCMHGEEDRILRYGEAGLEPWATFRRRGLDVQVRAELRWLDENVDALRS
ncbi:MAG: aminoglycoside phosphotransferase family protein [Rhizomicrobium sp.]